MGGLVFILLAGVWLAVALMLSINIPKWLGMKPFLGWVLCMLLLPVLLVAPFVDDIVGMRQFEQLCKERAVVRISPEASQVKRAQRLDSVTMELPGRWIKIESQSGGYVDLDTKKPFMTFEAFHTKGGRIAAIAMMGGSHSCFPKDEGLILKRLNMDQLLEQGKKS